MRRLTATLCLTFAVLLGSYGIFSQNAFARDLLLYGGDNHDKFLGCLVCNEFDSDSVCNEFGSYGNEFGSNMWNEFSNDQCVPVLLDRQRNFYGYFTTNSSRTDAVGFADSLKRIFKRHNGDVEKVRKTLCDLLNR